MAAAQIIPVKVGVVLDMDKFGEMAVTCLTMALSEFYSTHSHYKTRLLLTTRDSKGEVVGAAAAVAAIIGPAFSTQANFLISLGDRAQVPIISFEATSPSLSSIRSPYFARTTLNDSSQVDAIAAIIKAFGWREIVPVYEDNEFGEGIVPYLTDALENVNVRIPYRSVIPPLATDDQIEAELYKLMTMQTRVFVVHMMSPLASRFFAKAREIGLMSQEFAWIVTNGVTNELNSLSPPVLESMLGVVGVRHHVPRTKELRSFEIRYKEEVKGNSSKVADLDIFGLWGYDSAVALAMAAEKAGLKNLRHRRRITPMNSTDLEEFGVSEQGPRLIRALSSITFKGLAGDFKLVDGQLQAPPLEIVNFVGHGVRGIGYWTKENGIMRELNSKSFTANAYTADKFKLGTIIWPGDRSSPPKGWVVPTNGRKLRVGVPIKEGYFEFVKVTWNPDNSTEVKGYCIDVFDAVMAALPYGVPYEYIPFENPYNHSMAGNYNDLTYQVFLGKYDAVAGDVTIVANRSEYVDFTLPYAQSGVAMVVPVKDDKSKNAWVFAKPLTWQLWLMTFASFLFIGFLIWVLEHDINDDIKKGSFWHRVGIILCFAFSTMVFAHKEKVVRKGKAKIAAAFHEIPYIKLFLGRYCSRYTMIHINKAEGFGIVFPIGSPLVTDVSRAILNVTEGQKMVEIEKMWLKAGDKCSDPDYLDYDSPKNLGLGSFWFLFLVVGLAGGAAVIAHKIMLRPECINRPPEPLPQPANAN